MDSIWKEYLIVKWQEIKTQEFRSMDMLYISVEHLSLGSQKQEEMLP
jgi:hypothetical protein